MSEDLKIVKCIAIGDGSVGKTCLLTRLANKEFPEGYTPTIFENSSTKFHYNGKIYGTHLIDTAGQENYESLRTQAYGDVHVFLVCFSISSVDSFTNITVHWLPEIRRNANNPALILVGTKSDLRTDQETIDIMNSKNQIFVSKQSAENSALKNKMKYIECSARTKYNIEELQRAIVEAHLARMQQSIQPKSQSYSPHCISPVMNFINRTICCKMCPFSTD